MKLFSGNKPLYIFLAFVIIGIAVYVLFFETRPEEADPQDAPVFQVEKETVKEAPKWEDVGLGKDDFESVKDQYGNVLKERELEGGKKLYDMSWKSKYIPLVVGTETSGTVSYVEVPQPLVEKPVTYEELFKTYSLKEPNLVLYVPGSMYTRLAVHLQEGIAYEYHVDNKEILRVMYFVPVDNQTFLKTWGSRFSTTLPQQWN